MIIIVLSYQRELKIIPINTPFLRLYLEVLNIPILLNIYIYTKKKKLKTRNLVILPELKCHLSQKIFIKKTFN